MMNDLAQLEEYIPKLKEDYQYSELAKKIGMAISLGKHSTTMSFSQPLSSEAVENLMRAKVSYRPSGEDINDYVFTF